MPRFARMRRSAGGFSVLELLMGGGLTAMCALGFAAALPTTDPTAHPGVHAAAATALLERMMVTVRNRPFDRIGLYNGQDGQGTDTRAPENFPQDAPAAPPDPERPAPPHAGAELAQWTAAIEQALNGAAGVRDAYGTVRAECVARDEDGRSVLERVTVTVGWTEAGGARRVGAATLVSGL